MGGINFGLSYRGDHVSGLSLSVEKEQELTVAVILFNAN